MLENGTSFSKIIIWCDKEQKQASFLLLTFSDLVLKLMRSLFFIFRIPTIKSKNFIQTILGKIFGDFFMFWHSFTSQKVKQNRIFLTREWRYELLNDVRLRNVRNLKKTHKFLDEKGSVQLSTLHESFYSCARILEKITSYTFYRKT